MSNYQKVPSVNKRLKKEKDDIDLDLDFVDDEDLTDLIDDSDSNQQTKSLNKNMPIAENFPEKRKNQATF